MTTSHNTTLPNLKHINHRSTHTHTTNEKSRVRAKYSMSVIHYYAQKNAVKQETKNKWNVNKGSSSIFM